jgi:putative transposase
MSGVSKARSAGCAASLDERARPPSLNRPIRRRLAVPVDRRHHVKTREASRIVSVAVIVAVGVNTDGQRGAGLKVGHSEAEPFWTSSKGA